MEKKVTLEQVQALYKFTRQHYVEHYDVQTELVDHLANDIETIWKEYPNLTFEEARNRSFKKFGVFGFMDMYDARKKAMSKKYYKILWQHFKEWFRLPKILATISLFLLLSFGLENTKNDYVLLGVFFVVLILVGIQFFYHRKVKKIKAQRGEKRWLLEDIILNGGLAGGALTASNWYNIFLLTRFDYDNYYVVLFVSATTTVYLLFIYVTTYVLPPKASQFLEEHYPEYKFETT